MAKLSTLGFLLGAALAAKKDLFPSGSGVLKLTEENFEKKTNQKQVNWVLYYSPKDEASKKLGGTWIKAAGDVNGLANFAAVDCTASKVLCEEGEELPIIKVFQEGDSTTYTGKTTQKALVKAVNKQMPEGKITPQTLKGHSKWLEQNKELPKAIMFTVKKDTVPPLWKAMAYQLEGRMSFAVSPKASRKLNRKYAVKDYPSIVVIPAGDDLGADEDDDDDDDDEGNYIAFDGPVDSGFSVKSFLEQHALPDPDADNEPLPIEELSDESCMKAFCVNAAGLCAVMITSVNPDSPDMGKLRSEVAVWNQVKELREDNLFNFAWMDGIKQMDFLDKALHIQPQDYPQVVVIAGRKLRYRQFVGSYTPDKLNGFLTGVQKARIKTDPMGIKELPALAGEDKRCKDMKVKKKPAQKPKKQQEAGLRRHNPGHRGNGLAVLTEDNFDNLVMPSTAAWVVAFIDQENDPDTAEAFKTAHKKLKGYIKFGLVDVSVEENKELAEDRANVASFPAVRVLRHGPKDVNSEWVPFHGSMDAEGFEAVARAELRANEALVTDVTQTTLPNWIQKNPMRPRVLICLDKDTVPDMLVSMAMEFSSRELLTGVSLNDPQFAAQFGVTEFPAVLMLQGNQQTQNEEGESGVGLEIRQVTITKKPKFKEIVRIFDELAFMWAAQKFQNPELAEGDIPEAPPSHDEL